MPDAPSRTFTVAPEPGTAFEIALPFDPKAVFGKARAPVVVAINGHIYRSTVADMGNGPFVPFRKSHREAAGLVEGGPAEVILTLDTAPREVECPADLRAALDAAGAWDRWQQLSYTRRREDAEAVEGAKKPDTRARRVDKIVSKVEPTIPLRLDC